MYRLDKDYWGACNKALKWIAENNIKTLEEAWEKCKRGDWMMWLYVHLHPDHIKERVLVAGLCVNTVRHLMKDIRSITAVDSAIAFGKGEISKHELKIAAADASYADTEYTIYYTAFAAAASYRDSDYAVDASYVAFSYDDSDLRKENQLKTAEICRKYLHPIF